MLTYWAKLSESGLDSLVTDVVVYHFIQIEYALKDIKAQRRSKEKMDQDHEENMMT